MKPTLVKEGEGQDRGGGQTGAFQVVSSRQPSSNPLFDSAENTLRRSSRVMKKSVSKRATKRTASRLAESGEGKNARESAVLGRRADQGRLPLGGISIDSGLHHRSNAADNQQFPHSSSQYSDEDVSASITNTEDLPSGKAKKKLVFLSCRVYEKAREHCITNGTQIAREILEESRKLNMNFDFKNVQRRVYDALNVLTALDMVKKDRNKIEFIRDVHEVFGEDHKHPAVTPEKIKDEKQAETNNKIKLLKEKRAKMATRLQEKKQYFEEITVQVALLKKLVRRNLLHEESVAHKSSPDKPSEDQTGSDSTDSSRRIKLPMLVFELNRKSDYEVLINEDHKEVVILSDTEVQIYNDNHVLLSTGLLNGSDQGTIQNLYDTEIKAVGIKHEEQDSKLKNNNEGYSPSAKENVYKDNDFNSPLCKGFMSNA